MASFDLREQVNVESVSTKTKVFGWCLIVLSVLLMLSVIFQVPVVVKSVALGVFGLFFYPFMFVLFCLGLALLTNKKYVLPIKYLVYLCIAVYCILAIINLIVIGNKPQTVSAYLTYSYDYKYTGGGVISSLVVAPLEKTIGVWGTAIILFMVLCIMLVLIVDFLHSIKKYGFKKVLEKSHKKKNVGVIEVCENKARKKMPQKSVAVQASTEPEPEFVQTSKEFNLFLDEKMQEHENKLALMKLGLIEGNLDSAKAPSEKQKQKTLREHLLTPPELDVSYFSYGLPKEMRQKEEIKENIETLKKDNNANQKLQEFMENQTDKLEDVEENVVGFDDFERFENDSIKQVEENDNKFLQEDEYAVEDEKTCEEMPKSENNHQKYIFPPINLLEKPKETFTAVSEDVVGKQELLEETLKTFGIDAHVKGVVIGPSVTRYEIEMPHGVSVKRIVALEDDISMALASRSGVRIEAPIPGKSAVGIEVPNESIAMVTLREVLESDVFQKNTSPVTFALGKNISGASELCNLAKMPHVLVAGATNSGKSICLNAIILSMIFKAGPEDLRLILIDPKRVEFSLYNDLPHLLIPKVITEVDKAVNALLWCVNEMERRFELLSIARCRNSEDYNKTEDVKNGIAPKMPYIVVIVDELADLMSSGKKEIEEYLRRLTQKARAAGILLVLATQRPSVDVITGVIKTNCPARISFALTSAIDSRTILDCGGAESLLGKGDMLYKPSDAPSPRRVQGCYVSADEVEKVVEFVKANTEATYDENTENEIDKVQQVYVANQIEGNIGDTKWDPLLPQALKMFIENGQASTSAIQRRFLAGFPRASRIVDQLCQMGYLSQPEGTKPRTVLITLEEFYEKFGRDFE